MKKCFTFITTLFITFSFAQFQLSGKIVEKGKQDGLKDCVIYVDSSKTPYFSEENGDFEIPLSKGSHQIKIVKMGFDELNQELVIDNNQYILFEIYPAGTGPENKNAYKSLFTDEVIVNATRANENSPIANTTITAKELNEENLGQDLTYLMKNQQSVVVFSDAGNGVGYTSMRIRGTDMSRINFTINGMPYNDPESQGVFLVDMPDIASSMNDIQIQRGVGTSTNGAAAFGASVNMNTNTLNKDAYAEINNSVGSFSTFKNTFKAGTGLIKDKFTFDARGSHLKSDGYIDRASSKLWSYYLSGAYYGENTIIRANHFSGIETTYQSWNGVDRATMETDRTFNSAGTDYGAKSEPYDNEIDQYKQDHYQLMLSQQINTNWVANVGLFYTRGKGYYEQYKVQSKLANYGLDNVIIGGDTIERTDLIRRRWLDNHYYGANFSVNYKKLKKINFTFGGAWNQYDGDHYGEIIWAQYTSNGDINHIYYDNNGLKTDFNVFAKADIYLTKKLIGFIDLQYRNVAYNVSGLDSDGIYIYHDKDFNFVNPKAGLSYLINNKSKAYASFAVANREPTRNDFLDNVSEPKHETLYDLEAGYQFATHKMRLSANYYYMKYNNQLVLNGELNDVGAAVRINVKNSFRTGLEAAAGYDFGKIISLDANATWSVNEIKEYEDENNTTHTNSKIAYSPQWIGGIQIGIKPTKDFTIGINNKFVGEQFLDNTTNTALKLDRYMQNDLRLAYMLHTEAVKDIEFTFLLNNFTNRKIVSNAYVYYGEAYLFPQATINFMFGMNLKF